MSADRRDPLEWVSSALSGVLRERFTLMVNQRQSALGADNHIAAVVRRMRCNEPGAAVLDGRYLLTVEAHAEELELARRASKNGSGEGGVHAG